VQRDHHTADEATAASTSENKKGIERRILAPILWIGLVPLLVSIGGGYGVARWMAEDSARERVQDAAQQASSSLVWALRFHKTAASGMARDPNLRSHVEQDPSMLDEEQARGNLLRWTFEDGVSQAAAACLYDRAGRLLVSAGAAPVSVAERLDIPPEMHDPFLHSIRHDELGPAHMAIVMSPMFAADTGEPVGAAVRYLDLENMARDLYASLAQLPSVVVPQLIVEADDRITALWLAPAEEAAGVRTMERQAHPQLQALLEWDAEGVEPFHQRFKYPLGDTEIDALVAGQQVEDGIAVAAAMPAAAVFQSLNLAALFLIVLCALTVALLYMLAYRRVHKSIVRNIMLLNEGTQLIGRGDLDLRLDIQTGDELEELAQSFNQMAQDLKNNINQLEQSERKYRSLVQSMRDGIIQTTMDGEIVLINPLGARIFGYDDPEELVGRSLRSLFPEAVKFEPLFAEVRERGFVERSRVWIARDENQELCLELSASLMQDEASQTIGVEGIFRDVTTGVLLEREARERAERISAINQIANVINSSLQAGRLYESLAEEIRKLVDFDFASISVLDEQGEAFEMHKLLPAEGQEEGATCPVHARDWCAPLVARNKESLVIDDLSADDVPAVRDFPAGIVSALSTPLYASGRIVGTVNLGSKEAAAFSRHDKEVMEQISPHVAVALRNTQLVEHLRVSLDEVTLAQNRLHEANEELKTLDEMKTNLLSNVSHELRTPLVAVMGYTDMIYNEKVGEINESQKEYLGISLRNIEKLVTLIENLLDFSRLHRGAETLAFDAFNLTDCARSSMEIVKPVAESREIEVEMKAPAEPVLVEGDKGKIGQVFTNLLSNAVKFNHHGGSVTVEIKQSEDSVEAIVSDTGVGMPPEALERVFTRFYQFDSSSTRKYGGTGIGLSIAQDIMRLHGSRLTVDSEVGKGSTFRFTLPLKSRRRDDEEARSEADQVAETRLLVELATVDRALVTQLRVLLESEGIDLLVGGVASRAVSIAAKHHPDCVMIDLESGDIAPKMLDDMLDDPETSNIPIILYTSDDDLYEKYRAVVATRIRPGFRKSTLLSAIHYALGQGADVAERFGNRVLCVDDDEEVQRLMSRVLEAENYDVDACRSGEEALRMLADREYGLVLLDIAMPGMDGWEACRRIKSDPRLGGIKVYMVTAKPIETSGPRSRETGADGYLLKPFRPEDLVELVRGVKTVRPRQEA
jgi:PAS domain S-box-containing protein